MKVKELIEELQNFPQDAVVYPSIDGDVLNPLEEVVLGTEEDNKELRKDGKQVLFLISY